MTPRQRSGSACYVIMASGQYEHVMIGYNWRLTEMQAAMGRVQLRKLDAILARKHAKAAWMSQRLALPGITPPKQMPHTSPTHMLYTCLLDMAGTPFWSISTRRDRGTNLLPASAPAADLRREAREPAGNRGGRQRMLSIPMHHAQLSQRTGADC